MPSNDRRAPLNERRAPSNGRRGRLDERRAPSNEPGLPPDGPGAPSDEPGAAPKSLKNRPGRLLELQVLPGPLHPEREPSAGRLKALGLVRGGYPHYPNNKGIPRFYLEFQTPGVGTEAGDEPSDARCGSHVNSFCPCIRPIWVLAGFLATSRPADALKGAA